MRINIYTNKYFIYFLIGVSFFFLVVAVSIEAIFTPAIPGNLFTHFNEGWTMNFDGETYSGDKISDIKFPRKLRSGDVILLKNKLPDDLSINESLSVLFYLSAVRAFIDGQQIYQCGTELVSSGRLAPSCYHYIPIPDNAAGKTIVIEVIPSSPNAFTNIGSIMLVRSDLAYFTLSYNKRSSLFVGVFLCTLGFILLLIGLLVSIFRRKASPLVSVGALSTCIGFWSLCYENTIQLFSFNIYFTTALEYFSLYAAVIPALSLIRYFLVTPDSDNMVRNGLVLNLLRVIASLFFLLSLALHFSGLFHAPSLLIYFHIMVLLMLFMIFFFLRHSLKKKSLDRTIMQIGLVELCFITGIDLIRFNFQKYVSANDASRGISIIPFGTVLFIIILLASSMVRSYTDITDKIAADTEKEVYKKMAYNDRLTGLYNRAMGEEIFQRLDMEDVNYCIISIDLNGLKKINDNYGHRQGDKLLVSFSKILSESFKNTGDCIRMGGDEFMVVIYEEQWDLIDAAIEAMKKRCIEESKATSLNIDASYGLAKNTESDVKSSEQIYRIADARMYEMKVQSKKNRTD